MDALATADPLCRRPGYCPPHVTPLSIFVESKCEIDRHKWILSQQAGRDMGEEAVRDWIRTHWCVYLRSKWMEHLQGVCFWMELDQGDFGLLQREFPGDRGLLDTIVDKLKSGEENLDVLLWAIALQIPLDPVIQILEALDVNSRRLVHQFDS